MTASELVHLLKADVLQSVTDEQNGQEGEPKIETDEATQQSLTDCQLISDTSSTKLANENEREIDQMANDENTNAEQ